MSGENFLPDHPYFQRLSENNINLILKAAEIWEAERGSAVFYPGDSASCLIFVLEGILEEKETGRKIFAGETWGAGRLEDAGILEIHLTAAEHTIWIQWNRDVLFFIAAEYPKLRRELEPVYNSRGELVSGIPVFLKEKSAEKRKKKKHIHLVIRKSYRKIMPYFIAAVLLTGALIISDLPLYAAAVPSAVYFLIFTVFSFNRLFSKYTLDEKYVSSAVFNGGNILVVNQHVPLEMIQGIEIRKNGLFRKIFNYGNIIINTAASENSISIPDAGQPEKLKNRILENKTEYVSRDNGRKKETLRRYLEEQGLGSNVPVKIKSAEIYPDDSSAGKIRKFRKSPVILIWKIMPPFLMFIVTVLTAVYFGDSVKLPLKFVYAVSLVFLLWSAYKFEDWRNDVYIVSGAYLIDIYRKPLGIKETKRQIDLLSVQGIRYEQKNFISFIFGFGDIILSTAGNASDSVLKYVSRPWMVQSYLFNVREAVISRKKEKEHLRQKEEITEIIKTIMEIR